ncbi:formyl peptide receptor 3 [Chelydra serpentina]|uniref:Formyl peptide receptor 3 n=1 Tax=Chelydra serpentina TaxID=8475 RepID=A0A8T1S0U0_CHESE|nr:formyl peptide receptor 3 [Chelydra serpentina]
MAFPILSMVLCGVAFLVGLPLNGYVLFVTSCRVERTASAVWFLNRAVADFIFMVFLPLRFIFILNLDKAKTLSNTVTCLHMFSSAFLLTALSVDRCILVARPEWAWNHRTPLLAFRIVMGIWALSVGFSLRYGDLWETLLSPASTGTNVPFDEWRVQAAVQIQFLVGFLIPLALILIPTFYIVVAAKLRGNRLIQSTKPLKILCGLIPTFFLCWLPYHVFSFLLISPKYPLPFLVTESNFACVLSYFNSCLNPVFYLTMEEEFLKYWQRARNPQTTDNSEPEMAE